MNRKRFQHCAEKNIFFFPVQVSLIRAQAFFLFSVHILETFQLYAREKVPKKTKTKQKQNEKNRQKNENPSRGICTLLLE